jgi:uncharacterized membrane protein YdbT with pleckstrin-like domain
MSYVDTMLANGERILRREHQHWFMLLWGSRFALAAMAVAVVLLLFRGASNQSGTLMDVLGLITFALFAGGLVVLFWNALRYQNEEYVITSRRIVHSEGVINKRATDSSLEKINDAILSESVWGRMFGFGDLDVLTASESGIERLRMLRDAKTFKKVMVEAKHELELELTRPVMPPARAGASEPAQARAADPAMADDGPRAAITPDEVTYSLDRLGDLRDRGIITPEEFEAKKRELLDRL